MDRYTCRIPAAGLNGGKSILLMRIWLIQRILPIEPQGKAEVASCTRSEGEIRIFCC